MNIGYNIKKNTNMFINESKSIHGDKFTYEKTDYKSAKTKVIITCKIHGDFLQTPNKNLLGQGCPHCRINKKLTQDSFIEKANKIHNNKYIYDLVKFVNNRTKIKIRCPEHGTFEQLAANHLHGEGCPNCGMIKQRINIINKKQKTGEWDFPNFNIKACELFDEISKNKNVKIQHALNGGEYYIKELGYWVDGYDKDNNVVYEFYEKSHFRKGKLIERDVIREKEIKNFLKCEFISFTDFNPEVNNKRLGPFSTQCILLCQNSELHWST